MFRRPIFVQFNPSEIQHLVLQIITNYTNLAQIYSFLLGFDLDELSLFLLDHMQEAEFNSLQDVRGYFINNYGDVPQITTNQEGTLSFANFQEGITSALRYKTSSIELINLILNSMPEDYPDRQLFENLLTKDYEHENLLNALYYHSLHA